LKQGITMLIFLCFLDCFVIVNDSELGSEVAITPEISNWETFINFPIVLF